MNDITEKCAVELSWNKVASIVSEEIEEILRGHVQCKVIISENTYWDITFIGHRLSSTELFHLAQAIQATSEDLEDTQPAEGRVDFDGIGMVLAEKLLGRHLKLIWENCLITKESLWLVGVASAQCYSELECKRPERIEIYWQDLTLSKQREILQVFGENGNWDVFPIATIDVPAEDETEL